LNNLGRKKKITWVGFSGVRSVWHELITNVADAAVPEHVGP